MSEEQQDPPKASRPTFNSLKDQIFDFSKDVQFNTQGPHYMNELKESDGF